MIIDATLREGAQAHGVYFKREDRAAILRGLAATGVDEAEAGWAGQDELADTLALGARVAPRLKLAVWCRCRIRDVDMAVQAGACRVHMGIPASDAHRRLRLGLEREQLLEHLRKVLEYARGKGLRHVTLGLEDAGRADEDFLETLARAAARYGAHRLRCSDTVGILTPDALTRLVLKIRRAFGGPVAVHCHNDLGLATANALAALDGGADAADASLLGLGERAGITRLEELAAALVVARGRHFNLEAVRRACLEAAKAVGMTIPRHWPVAGDRLFAVESGVHLHGMERDPSLFELYPPELVGAARRLDAGAKCGVSGVAQFAARMGLRLSAEDLPACAREVRRRAAALGRPLTETELAGILAATAAEASSGATS